MAQLFTNNSASTLAVAMSDSILSVVVASGEGALFASPSGGDYQMVTLNDPVTGDYEIVKVTARSGDNLSVVRGQEGTTAVAWSTGVKVEARITAGSLTNFLANLSQDADGLAAGTFAQNVGTTARPFLASTAYERGDVVRASGGDLGVVVIAGTNSATPLTEFDSGFDGTFAGAIYVLSGTVGVVYIEAASYTSEQIALGYKAYGIDRGVAIGRRATAAKQESVAVGHRAAAIKQGGVAVGNQAIAGDGVAVGDQSESSGIEATALGKQAAAKKTSSVAVGKSATVEADYGTAVGAGALASAQYATALGYNARAAAEYSFAFGSGGAATRQREVLTVGHFIAARDDYNAGFGSYRVAAAESAFGSIYMELATPATWAASTSYKDGDIVQPTTPNGLQYHLWHGEYNPASLPNTITSQASEPTWATGIQDYTPANVANTSGWVGADLSVGHDEEFPPDTIFFPTEIGFYCSQYSSVTAAPFVSIGTVASPTLLVNNQQLSDITAANMRHVFAGLKHGITDLRIKLETPATGAGAKFFGKFYAKGLFVPTQG